MVRNYVVSRTKTVCGELVCCSWNSMFSHTYYFVLEVLYGLQKAGSHPIAAFISAVIIFHSQRFSTKGSRR